MELLLTCYSGIRPDGLRKPQEISVIETDLQLQFERRVQVTRVTAVPNGLAYTEEGSG